MVVHEIEGEWFFLWLVHTYHLKDLEHDLSPGCYLGPGFSVGNGWRGLLDAKRSSCFLIAATSLERWKG